MSDCNHDVKQKMCQMGKCKPTPGALTREELRDVLTIDNSIMYRIPKSTRENVLAHDAALRATIEQRDGQIEKLAAFIVLIPGEPSKSEGAVDTAIRIITQQARELAEANAHIHEQQVAYLDASNTIEFANQQLAASQARCRVMEREIETLTTCGCEGCDDNLEESAFCFPCMNKVQKQVTQLQATLAALEEERDELKYRLQVHADLIGETEHSLRTQLAAMRLTWTTARPTVAGDWWVRYGHDGTPKPVGISRVDEALCMRMTDGGLAPVDNLTFDNFLWSDKPIPLPTEPQQARGSSGGAADHYGGQK